MFGERQRTTPQAVPEGRGIYPEQSAAPATAQIKNVLWTIFVRTAMRPNEFTR